MKESPPKSQVPPPQKKNENLRTATDTIYRWPLTESLNIDGQIVFTVANFNIPDLVLQLALAISACMVYVCPRLCLLLFYDVRYTCSVAAGFGRHSMPPPACNPDLWPFDFETGVRVASKVGKLPSKFGHARPLGSRSRYVRNGPTDSQTDGQTKATLIAPS